MILEGTTNDNADILRACIEEYLWQSIKFAIIFFWLNHFPRNRWLGLEYLKSFDKLSISHFESSYELVRQINSKGSQGVFFTLLHHKKDIGEFHRHQSSSCYN